MTRLKMTTAALLSCGILALGTGLLAQQKGAGGAGQRVDAATKGTVPIAPAVRSLVEARIATGRQVYQECLELYRGGVALTSEEASVWSRHCVEDELRLNPGPAQRLAAIVEHLERVKAVERIADAYARNGQGRAVDAYKAKYFRLEAEQMLAEAQALYPNIPLPVSKRVPELPAPVPAPTPPPPK